MARSLMDNYKEIQHQCQHHTSHWKSVWQGPGCSPVQWQYRRMVQNHHKVQNGDRSRQDKSDDKNPNGFQREIKIKGQRLEEVENFKYLGAIISNEGSKPEILSRIAQTTAALSRLKIIWRDKNISLASKVKLIRTLILSTFLDACESWTLTTEIGRRIQALEMRCYRSLLNISYKDHVTNEEVRNRIHNEIGVHDDLLTMVKKRKLRWYGHISRSSGMAKIILQGTVKGARRRQKKRWEDNIKEWTGMGFGDSLRAAEDREGWKGIVATSSVVPRRPPRLRDWDEMRWKKIRQNNSMTICLKLFFNPLFIYNTSKPY